MSNFNVVYGSKVTFTAVPDEGYRFVGFFEGICGDSGFVEDYDKNVTWNVSGNELTITMVEDTAVYAVFEKMVKLTFIGSAVDNDNLADPYEVYIQKGNAIWSLDDSTRDEILDHFTKDGYVPFTGDLSLASEPLSKYSSCLRPATLTPERLATASSSMGVG